jgi:hypothetical protein
MYGASRGAASPAEGWLSFRGAPDCEFKEIKEFKREFIQRRGRLRLLSLISNHQKTGGELIFPPSRRQRIKINYLPRASALEPISPFDFRKAGVIFMRALPGIQDSSWNSSLGADG